MSERTNDRQDQPLSQQLPVVETFHSLQGEGLHAGRSAFFIRLAGCTVGCSWCDTKHSWPQSSHPLQRVENLAAAAAEAETVGVILDSNATISSSNLIHESAMTPGQYYYLAREKGKLVSADAPSGITMAGGYAAVAPLGLALSTSELQVEIQGPIILVD